MIIKLAKPFVSAIALLAASPSFAQNLDLSRYTLTNTYDLPASAAESSAITYNWDTKTLFVVGDEGRAVVEVSRGGEVLSTMSLVGFEDTEALTYVGNGRFVIGEERIQDAYQFTYAAGTTVSRQSLPSFSFGPTVGNEGLEGLSYDPSTGSFFGVKEKNPQAVYQATIDFTTGTGSVTQPFTPALGVTDLSDIQVLATVPAFASQSFADNLLIFSQESRLLLEVNRSGQVLSSFDFRRITAAGEGVTIDEFGTIYVTGEQPAIYVLSPNFPVPGPGALAFSLAGIAFAAATARRRKSSADR